MTEEQMHDEAFESAHYAKMDAAAKAWKERWPNACTSCRGAGGSLVRNYPHAPDDFEPCSALPDYQCHRCAFNDPILAVVEDGVSFDTPMELCPRCGWHGGRGADDMVPEW